jgi:hypothetical protein
MRWSAVSSLGVAVLLFAPCANTQGIRFQAKVKIPYALQSGSRVIEPGEYLAKYWRERGSRIMTLQDSKGEILLRATAEGSVSVPKEERNFAGDLRVRITRVADQKSPGKQWVVFNWDYKIGDKFFRVSFSRVAEVAGNGATH